MKTFKRTPSGLNNQHLFYGVDFIVYLEGGSNAFNKQEVSEGRFNEETLDILFWSNVFSAFSITNMKFKSVGSKSTLIEIAEDIINGIVGNTIVAMDQEFDGMLSRKIRHPKVLYTYGYSWENDVWGSQIVKEVIEELSTKRIMDDCIEKNIDKFLSEIKIGVIADAYLFKKTNSFFPRPKGYLALVNCSPKDLPHVVKNSMKELLKKKTVSVSTLYGFARRTSFDIKYSCYGHLLADYCNQVIIHYLKNRLKLPSVHSAYIQRMGIRKYFYHFSASISNEYYGQIVTQAIGA